MDTLKEIRSERPKLPVLILSIHPEDQYAVRALKAGAAGYMTKESAPDHLIKAIRKVLQGGKYISPSLAEPGRPFSLSAMTRRLPMKNLSIENTTFSA